jgi:hypothetical protein
MQGRQSIWLHHQPLELGDLLNEPRWNSVYYINFAGAEGPKGSKRGAESHFHNLAGLALFAGKIFRLDLKSGHFLGPLHQPVGTNPSPLSPRGHP